MQIGNHYVGIVQEDFLLFILFYHWLFSPFSVYSWIYIAEQNFANKKICWAAKKINKEKFSIRFELLERKFGWLSKLSPYPEGIRVKGSALSYFARYENEVCWEIHTQDLAYQHSLLLKMLNDWIIA